jgi:uncharacterized membrane protein YbaN (DUF454 family)
MHPFTTTLTRTFWMVLGFIFVAIGIIGYITPMMPGLVFFLMATFCFAKGSRKFLRLLISNKYVGQQIIDFKRGKGMTMRTKIIAIITMLVSMFISAFFSFSFTFSFASAMQALLLSYLTSLLLFSGR